MCSVGGLRLRLRGRDGGCLSLADVVFRGFIMGRGDAGAGWAVVRVLSLGLPLGRRRLLLLLLSRFDIFWVETGLVLGL